MDEKRLKKVTVEFRPRILRDVGYADLMEGIDRVTVLSPISLMPEKTAIMGVVKWSGREDEERFTDNPLIDQVVDMGAVKDGRMYLFLGKEEPWYYQMIQMVMEDLRVFIDWPVILEKERIRIVWIGYIENIAKLMELFKDMKMEETITSMVNYDPARSDLLDGLTSKQYDTFVESYDRGFFDDRRKVTINQLAKEQGVSAASYMKTLRRAQRNLLKKIFANNTRINMNPL